MSLTPSFLVIDKPAGITSHDVVAAVRAVTGVKKVGHTGTLDPFARGVLPLALGRATRLIQYLDESEKVYDALVRFGSRTDTGDPTGEVIAEGPLPTATMDQVVEVLDGFLGDRMQVPPKYSAVKHKGKALYKYARQGEEVTVPARPITLHKLVVLDYDNETLRVVITCSRGTYARVLAEEIAEALGSEGHLEALVRLRSGPFGIDGSLSFPELAEMVSAEDGRTWEEVLLSRGKREDRVQWKPRDAVRAALTERTTSPLDALSHLPLQDVDADRARLVKNGGPPPPPPTGLSSGMYLVVSGSQLLALAEQTPRGPKTVRVV